MPHNRTLAIVNYFLDLGKKAKVEIEPMKIQKLIYFAHGWHLALVDGPLIQEHVEAWDYGPVIPPVYHNFKKFGRHPITERAERMFVNLETGEIEIGEYELNSNPDVRPLLQRIWDVYGRLSGTYLANMTPI